jgi:hypothetical protein
MVGSVYDGGLEWHDFPEETGPMDRWDVLLIGVAGYVAVISLVRLMARRRNQLIQQVQRGIEGQLKSSPATDASSGGAESDDAAPGGGAVDREVA